MAGLVPAIYVLILARLQKTWKPGMTRRRCARSPLHPFVPAQAGTQASLISHAALIWIPAFGGMNGKRE
jgi:hypothetical protein